MLWFGVWSLLVVGTLVGAFFLGRRLWRSVVALGRELARASDVAQRLATQIEQLQAAGTRTDTSTSLLADRGAVRDRYDEVRSAARARRAQRRERDRQTQASWRAYWR